MVERQIPNPQHALGIDRPAWELIQRVRPLLRDAGIELGELVYNQDRHYIYPFRSGGRTLFLFFEWYRDATVWFAPTPFEVGTRCMDGILAYQGENAKFASCNENASPESAFVAGLRALFHSSESPDLNSD